MSAYTTTAAAAASVTTVTSLSQLTALLQSNNNNNDNNTNYNSTSSADSINGGVNVRSAATARKAVLFFWANWHEPSRVNGPMHDIISALSIKYPSIAFYAIEAEACPDISAQYAVTVVPTFYSCIGAKVLEKVEGASPAAINTLVKNLDSAPATAASVGSSEEKSQTDSKAALHARLERLIRTAPVMLFMKGTASQPKCGFSRQMVEILDSNKIPFASFDILTDEVVRSELKVYSDWPTYPQLYVNGSLVGGLDIVKEMSSSGDLKEQLGVKDVLLPAALPSLEDRLKALINRSKVMLFMKGNPSVPRCGFSRTIVEILNKDSIPFDSFDILTDEEVRSGLKQLSDWPTYPQLYVNGSLVGGLDIVKEMAEQGDLKQQLGL